MANEPSRAAMVEACRRMNARDDAGWDIMDVSGFPGMIELALSIEAETKARAERDEAVTMLRRLERGTVPTEELDALLAKYPEPVDPLVLEARKLVAGRDREPSYAENILSGLEDDSPAIVNCLTALRRGIEIAKDARP